MCFVGKAFFKPFRKAFTEIASLKERFAIKGLNEVSKVIKGSKVLIMGLTYKENVPDTRESPVREMVKELKEFGVDVYGYDPLLSKEEIEAFGERFGARILSLRLFPPFHRTFTLLQRATRDIPTVLNKDRQVHDSR